MGTVRTERAGEVVDVGQASPDGDLVAQQAAFCGRLVEGAIGALELYSIYLGDRLGLYQALRDGGPATPRELADRAGIHVRYAREWLEQQTVAGFLTVDDPAADEAARRFALPEALVAPLLDRDHPIYISFLARYLPAIGAAMPSVLDAYRSGGGVRWEAYGADAREGQEAQNRPFFVNELPGWVEAIPDVHERLRSGGAVADVCCGGGWLGIALALTYPKVTVNGFDADEASIAAARRNAAEAGVADRVRFEVADVSRDDLGGPYDLAVVFESLHDLARPVETLQRIRTAASGGTTLIVDERVDEAFSGPSEDPMQRFFHAASLVVCLPNAMAEQPSAATGTVMRPVTLRGYAEAAGYRETEVLPIEHMFFRAYRLHA